MKNTNGTGPDPRVESKSVLKREAIQRKGRETVNQRAERLADEHAALVAADCEKTGDVHAAIAFCECDTARDFRATKADSRYVHAKPGPVSFRPMVFVQGEWAGNGLRFATEAEALANALDLQSRWTLVSKAGTEPSGDPVNYHYDLGTGVLTNIETRVGFVPPRSVTL